MKERRQVDKDLAKKKEKVQRLSDRVGTGGSFGHLKTMLEKLQLGGVLLHHIKYRKSNKCVDASL